MPIDIIIFAAIALMLVLKLKSVLGTKNGSEPSSSNPFTEADNVVELNTPIELQPAVLEEIQKNIALIISDDVIDEASNEENIIEEGLKEIFDADHKFNLNDFMAGSQYAFNMIVDAYDKGDTDTLEPLMSEKLYADFVTALEKLKEQEKTSETIIHEIQDTKIIEAHLGGLMAYITVKYLVEQTNCIRDNGGAVIDGDPDKKLIVENIWTFTRDIRTDDPNWTLIKTRTTEK